MFAVRGLHGVDLDGIDLTDPATVWGEVSNMAELTVRGTAHIMFDTIIEVDVLEEVSSRISDNLPSGYELDELEVDEVEYLQG